MVTVEKIDIKDLDKKYKLCYISPINVKIGDISLNENYEGLVLFFSTDPKTLNGINNQYTKFSKIPYMDRDFLVLYIKDFLTVEINGTEINIYQHNNWLTADRLYSPAHMISGDLINNGVGCWLYNSATKDAINSNNNIEQVRKLFKKYVLEFYKISPIKKEEQENKIETVEENSINN